MAVPGITCMLAQRLRPLFSATKCFAAQKHTLPTPGGEPRGFEELAMRDYWETKYERQAAEGKFDWFLSEDMVSSLVCFSLLNFAANKDFAEAANTMHTRTTPIRVLDSGCGMSVIPLRYYEWTPFPVEMHCLDFSPAAVNFQLKTHGSLSPGHHHSSMCGMCANVTYLPYRDHLFHLVLDKGTMDALLKDPVKGHFNARKMLHEAERVLKKGGQFLQVTDEDPDSRMEFLETHSPKSCTWNFSILADSGQEDKECFVYTFSKE